MQSKLFIFIITLIKFNLKKDSVLNKLTDINLYKLYMDKIKINPLKENNDFNQIKSIKKAWELVNKLELKKT